MVASQRDREDSVRATARRVFNRIREHLDKISDGKTLELFPAEFALRPIRVYPEQLLGHVEIDFAFVDHEGFLGFFKTYPDAGWPDELLRDLHAMAVLRQEQVLSALLGSEEGEGSERQVVRPWTHHLFAFVPASDGEGGQDWSRVWNEIRVSRLIEEVGLSLLWCDPGAVDSADASREVDRFLAPLLLKVRLAQSPQGGLHRWREGLVERLYRALASPEADADDDARWARAQVERIIRGAFATAPRGHRLRLRALDRVQLRRFRKATRYLPFGRVVVVHGLNGSGKSTLMEAVELALTGRLRRLEEVASSENLRPTERDALYPGALRANGELGGELSVALDQESASGNGVDAPPPYEVFPVQVRDRDDGINADSFYLRQQEVRRFVECPPKDRYVWMAQLMGVPVKALTDSLDSIDKELRNRIRPLWHGVTGNVLPANRRNLLTSLQKTIGNSLQNAVDRAGRVIDAIEVRFVALELPDAAAPRWAVDLRQTIEEANRVRAQLADRLQKLLRAIGSQSAAPGGWDTLVEDVTAGFDQLVRLIGRFRDIRSALAAFLNDYRPAADKARGALDTPQPAPLGVPSGQEELRRLEGTLASLRTACDALRSVLRAVESAEALAQAAVQVRQQVADLPAPEALVWEGSPEGLTETISRVGEALQRISEEAAPLVRWKGHFTADQKVLAGALAEVEQRGRSLKEHVDRLRRQLGGSTGSTTHPRAGWEPHLVDLARFCSELGDPVEPAALEDPSRLREVLDTFTKCQQLLGAIPEKPDESLQVGDLLAVLRNWYGRDEDLDRCGLRSLLYLADYVAEKRDAIQNVAEEAVNELLEGEVESLWLELVWALTAHAWYQPDPQLKVSRSQGATIEATLHGNRLGRATAVFNLAELHILGLAWFFVSYLLEGRFVCNTVILDDPFQFLDDANLSAFLRNFDEVLRAIGADQVVLVVHQPAVREFLLHEIAGRKIEATRNGVPPDAGSVVFWDVDVIGPEASTVRPRVFEYRRFVAGVRMEVAGQPVGLGACQ